MKIDKSIKIFKFSFLIPLLFYFGKRSLVAFDEGFYAIQARWIIERNNWIGPLWWDQVSSDRTIGIQSLLALSQNTFGSTFFALYIPITISAMVMLFCTYHLHKELINNEKAFLSPLILSTTYLWLSYSHMATQDIVFSALVTIGLISSIKAYKTNQNFYLVLSGIWVGLAVMLKTYLTAIPLIAVLPFLINSKIIFKKAFWLGIMLGFIPFLFWSYKYISIYGYQTYSGIYEKLIRLSKNNNFTNPFYYYAWNLLVNIFPYSFLSLLGFLKAYRMKSTKKYFLFTYPLIIIILLSLFSTKTPYYPLQILSLVSLNSYLGLKSIIEIKNKRISFYISKINFILIPVLIIISILILNISSILDLDSNTKILVNIGAIIFSFSWLSFNNLKTKNKKFLMALIGPYILMVILVQSGLLTDKSKSIRLASEEIIKKENLDLQIVEVIKKDIKDDLSQSKIIKIILNMPNLGTGVDHLDDLNSNSFFWSTMETKDNNEKYSLISDNNTFYPWKLFLKR